MRGTRKRGSIAVVAVAVLGLVLGVVAWLLLGGREAPEWQGKLLVWGVPIVAVVLYLRRRSRSLKNGGGPSI